MSHRWLFGAVAAIALLAGALLWFANEGRPRTESPDISPGALFAATFRDVRGQPQSLAQFQGRVIVLNFWATWCAPCREEMPTFARLQSQWGDRQVQFVGLANDDPRRVERFGRELGIGYPLLVGGHDVDELAQRLGDRDRVIPFTVILNREGRVIRQKVGAYSETMLTQELRAAVAE